MGGFDEIDAHDRGLARRAVRARGARCDTHADAAQDDSDEPRPALALAATLCARRRPRKAGHLRAARALSAYTAATATTTGSVTIAVTGGNCFVRALTGTTVTFTLDPSTRVVHGDSISDGDRGTIPLRGPKTVDTTTVATVTPRLVIDQAGTRQSG